MAAMMATTITNALAAAGGDGDFAAAGALLDALGYRSDRIAGGQSGDAGDFVRQFPALAPGTVGERDFLREVASVRILFQVTDSEIAAAVGQPGLLDDGGGGFDTGNARSFLFAAVELGGDTYSRSGYAAFTREINKRIQVPTVVLFRTAAGSITLAFVHRRANRVDADRDVLGRVSLIREIAPVEPHRAHLDILADLALPARLEWMAEHGKSRNFDGLLDAWLFALDTEALNWRFYRELLAWFERAAATARFPTGEAVTHSPQDHIIRLITRLLFVWFLKEKGLVAGALFVEHQAAQLLKDYDRADGDSYYRAILQNLFFATLNTPIEQRGFSSGRQRTYRLFSYYRYAKQLADADGLTALLAQTPFVNGGLFDCLDTETGAREGGYRVDCFSDVHYGKLSIPNRLFFGGADAGTTGEPGLIDLLESYKFTVEENTPVEQEVALDPELLGKVFENLLAAVNPETSLTVRKETGSYYTPRPVVDYMVDEALAGALASEDGDESIRRLLDYEDADAGGLFDAAARERIVRAIADLRVIDPAVGSGAFPMGVLHKLTLVLWRLDPDNAIWSEVQRDQAKARAVAAYDNDDRAARESELDEINDIFDLYRGSDYGRKLYLIQNCIYGVDIQPIAVQIAKLRFFISLAIEQESDPDAAADNYGIRPLPNLETRFVAADTLRGLDAASAQLTLGQAGPVAQLQREVADNRERYFHAVNRAQKRQCQKEDTRLRRDLAKALEDAGFPAAAGGRIAAWDPFDQNAGKAEWFDPAYMFGVADGFDIVIANPPYVRQEEITPRTYKDALLKAYPDAAVGRSDLYCYFYARALQLLKDGGMHIFVCSNSWLDVGYGAKLQEYLLDNAAIDAIYESAVERQFSTAAINTVISVMRKESTKVASSDQHTIRFVRLLEEFEAALRPDGRKRIIEKTAGQLRAAGTDPEQRKPANAAGKGGRSGYVGDKWGGKYLRAPDIYHHILDRYGDKLVRLGDIATVRFGIKTGANEFFYLKPDRIKEFGIEEEFLAPVMTSPTESRSLLVDAARLPYQVFMCHQDKRELRGTGALAYIEWAERNHNWHTRPSTRGRRNWYDLGERTPPPLAMNRIIDERARAFTMPPGTYTDATLQEVHCPPESVDALAEWLNDDFAQVQYNVEGRANFGGGALELKIYETEKILVENQNISTPPRSEDPIHSRRAAGAGGGFEGAGGPAAAAGAVSVAAAVIGFGPLIRTRAPFFIPPAWLHLDKRQYYIYVPGPLLMQTATALNSTLTMLMLEYAGRANMSGIIELTTYETAALPIANPFGIQPPALATFQAADHSLVTRDRRTESGFRLTLTDTRRAIDAAVFEYLGLTVGERDGVYNAAYGAVVGRQLAEGRVSG